MRHFFYLIMPCMYLPSCITYSHSRPKTSSPTLPYRRPRHFPSPPPRIVNAHLESFRRYHSLRDLEHSRGTLGEGVMYPLRTRTWKFLLYLALKGKLIFGEGCRFGFGRGRGVGNMPGALWIF
ncbi:hypothetical protein BDQ17DRAFT_1358954 [Cyathus striatus]|nr:hypothetical protein BDQ17DRAFT_1358954 [Cyathus striatus]